MRLSDELAKQRLRLEKNLFLLKKREHKLKRNRFFQCHNKKCAKKTRLHKVILVQTHWYVEPHGCSGGDYWKQGEKQYICPKCSTLHRSIKKVALPENYNSLSYQEQQRIEEDRPTVVEQHFGLKDWKDWSAFDNVMDTYKTYGYIARINGKEKERENRELLSLPNLAKVFGLSLQVFDRFINI